MPDEGICDEQGGELRHQRVRVQRDLVVIEHSRHSLVIALQIIFSSQFESIVFRCVAVALIVIVIALVVMLFFDTPEIK